MKTEYLGIRLTEAEKAMLKNIADENGRSMSGMISYWINKFYTGNAEKRTAIIYRYSSANSINFADRETYTYLPYKPIYDDLSWAEPIEVELPAGWKIEECNSGTLELYDDKNEHEEFITVKDKPAVLIGNNVRFLRIIADPAEIK